MPMSTNWNRDSENLQWVLCVYSVCVCTSILFADKKDAKDHGFCHDLLTPLLTQKPSPTPASLGHVNG